MKEVTTSNPQLYQVIDWEAHFEGSRSKEYNNKTTCQMPTKHGLGYKQLVLKKNGAALFGAWCALIQVLSRHPKPRHGYLTDTGKQDGKAYTPEHLEILTSIPAKVFKDMLQSVASKDVGWLLSPRCHPADTTVTPRCPLNSDLDSDSDSDLDPDLDSKADVVVDVSNVKANQELADFELFYEAYPRQTGKKCAHAAYQKATNKPPVADMIEAVRKQKSSEQWMKDKGQYIPYPATWLNQERWKDKVEIECQAPKFSPLNGNEQMNMTAEQKAEYYRTGVKTCLTANQF